jgi:hypothetical protein
MDNNNGQMDDMDNSHGQQQWTTAMDMVNLKYAAKK